MRLLNPALWKKISSYRRRFLQARPFRYVVIPQAFHPAPLRRMRAYAENHLSLQQGRGLVYKASYRPMTFSSGSPFIRRWLGAFYREAIPFVESLTRKRFSRLGFPCTFYVYQGSDRLKLHTDNRLSRALAFVIHLSNLAAGEGGGLLLLKPGGGRHFTIAKRIPHKFNTLILFEIGPRSFHRMEPLRTEQKRLTVSGWFLHPDHDRVFLRRLKRLKRASMRRQKLHVHSAH